MKQAHDWVDVYIGLGSNLEDPRRQLAEAVSEIGQLPEVTPVATSPFYASHPVGPQDQPDYVNAVMHIVTRRCALGLLHDLQAIENRHGRVRQQRWGARTLDLDLLLYGDERIAEEDLTVPHPEMARRSFVLYPLADVAGGDLAIPGLGSLRALQAECPANGLRRLEA